jgi:putative nucleotidyltransferase with HDIG domain
MNIHSLISQARNLQPPSSTVIKLLALLGETDQDHHEIITTISTDAVLSAKLLARCNSVSLGLSRPIGSVGKAVMHLGYVEVHRMVMVLSFGAQIGVELRGYSMESGALWRHSLVTALLTHRIITSSASDECESDASIAYTAGLLHDIGKLVLDQTLDTDLRRRIQERVENKGYSLLRAEREVIGSDHAEVGAHLLQEWGLPEHIVEAVRNHHEPGGGKPRLSAIVHVADIIAHQTGASPGWGSLAVQIDAKAVQAMKLSETDLMSLTMAAFEVSRDVEAYDSGLQTAESRQTTAIKNKGADF